jgi:hypothetical protein
MTKKSKKKTGINIKNSNKVNIVINTGKGKSRTTKAKAPDPYKNMLYQQNGGISYYGGKIGYPQSSVNKQEYDTTSYIKQRPQTTDTGPFQSTLIGDSNPSDIKPFQPTPTGHSQPADDIPELIAAPNAVKVEKDKVDLSRIKGRELDRMIREGGDKIGKLKTKAQKYNFLEGKHGADALDLNPITPARRFSAPRLRSDAAPTIKGRGLDNDTIYDDEEDVVSVRRRPKSSTSSEEQFLEIFSNNPDREDSSPYSNSGSLHMTPIEAPSAAGGGNAFQDQSGLSGTGFTFEDFGTPPQTPKSEHKFVEEVKAVLTPEASLEIPSEVPVHNEIFTEADKKANPYLPAYGVAWYKHELGLEQKDKIKKDRLKELHDEKFPKAVKQKVVKSTLQEVDVPDPLPPIKRATMKTAAISQIQVHNPKTSGHEDFSTQEPSGESLTEIASGKKGGSHSDRFRQSLSQSTGITNTYANGLGIQHEPTQVLFKKVARPPTPTGKMYHSEGHQSSSLFSMQPTDIEQDFPTHGARDVRNSFL